MIVVLALLPCIALFRPSRSDRLHSVARSADEHNRQCVCGHPIRVGLF